METRRSFLKALSAVVAAPAIAMGATEQEPRIAEADQFGAPVWTNAKVLEAMRGAREHEKLLLEEAYKRAHPVITINAPQMKAADLNLGPGGINRIHQLPRYEWGQG